VTTRGRFWTLSIPWRYPAVALLLAFLVPLPWYLHGVAHGGWEFVETCILSENVKMPAGDASEGGTAHQKSILYYFWNQLVFLIPLAPFLPETVRWLLDSKSGEARWTMSAWFGAGLLLFLAAANKRHYYLLPLQPALAVMIGLAIDRAWAEDRRRFLAWGIGVTSSLLALVGIAALVGISRPDVLSKYAPGDVVSAIEGRRAWIWGFAGAVLAVSALQALSLRQGVTSRIRGALALVLVTIAGNSGIVDAVEGDVGKNRAFVSETSGIVGKDPVAVLRPFRTCGLHYYWPATLGQIEPATSPPGFLFMCRGLYKGAWAQGTILAVRKAKRSDDDVLLVRWTGSADRTPETPR
jgi:4-amino-4-deoxy-L-arabinose transferase-like glycosyltransferase